MIIQTEVFNRLIFCEILPGWDGEPELVNVTDIGGNDVTLSEAVWNKVQAEVVGELHATY